MSNFNLSTISRCTKNVYKEYRFHLGPTPILAHQIDGKWTERVQVHFQITENLVSTIANKIDQTIKIQLKVDNLFVQFEVAFDISTFMS